MNCYRIYLQSVSCSNVAANLEIQTSSTWVYLSHDYLKWGLKWFNGDWASRHLHFWDKKCHLHLIELLYGVGTVRSILYILGTFWVHSNFGSIKIRLEYFIIV